MLKNAFISDCEGPISKNDNAFELTSHFVPEGNKLFTIISRYDDVLFDVLKRPKDKHSINESERNQLKEFAKEISKMPRIEIPTRAKSIKDFPEKHQKTIKRLDHIFWENILNMDSGIFLKTITPIGGREKAEAIKNIAKQLNISLKQIVYVGDSITDVEAFKLIKQNGGLTISFNGNQYAIKNSEVAVLSENSIITSIIADFFFRSGKQNTIELIKNWDKKALKERTITPLLFEHFLQLPPTKLPKVKIITNENKKALSKESSEFRKKVRGELIGRLG